MTLRSLTQLVRAMRFRFRLGDRHEEQSPDKDRPADELPRGTAKVEPNVQSKTVDLKEKLGTDEGSEAFSKEEVAHAETSVKSPPEKSDHNELDLRNLDRKKQRLQLYKRDDVRRFLGWLLRANEKYIPVKSPATGEYAYSGVEFGLEDILPLLNELQSYGILDQKTLDTLPTCPECHHSNFYINFACPFCQNTALEQGNLLEHYPCGYSDFETNFQSGTNLICPKCNRSLKVVGTDYRKVTQSYRCMACAKFFGTPKLMFPCRTCTRVSLEQDVTLTPSYEFSLNKALKSEVVSAVSLDAGITTFLKKNGFTVTMPMELPGLSGIPHSFDLGAKNEKENKEVILDLLSAVTEVGPQQVVEFFAKVYDTKPPLAVLIAMPKISVEAQRLSAMYGVRAIAAADTDDALRKLIPILDLSTSPELSHDPPPTLELLTRPTATPSQHKESEKAQNLIEEVRKSLGEGTQPQTPKPVAVSPPLLITPFSSPVSAPEDEYIRQARQRMKRVLSSLE